MKMIHHHGTQVSWFAADCDTCRWMAPATYSRVGDMTAVHAQPTTPEERLRAYQALLACPT